MLPGLGVRAVPLAGHGRQVPEHVAADLSVQLGQQGNEGLDRLGQADGNDRLDHRPAAGERLREALQLGHLPQRDERLPVAHRSQLVGRGQHRGNALGEPGTIRPAICPGLAAPRAVCESRRMATKGTAQDGPLRSLRPRSPCSGPSREKGRPAGHPSTPTGSCTRRGGPRRGIHQPQRHDHSRGVHARTSPATARSPRPAGRRSGCGPAARPMRSSRRLGPVAVGGRRHGRPAAAEKHHRQKDEPPLPHGCPSRTWGLGLRT